MKKISIILSLSLLQPSYQNINLYVLYILYPCTHTVCVFEHVLYVGGRVGMQPKEKFLKNVIQGETSHNILAGFHLHMTEVYMENA